MTIEQYRKVMEELKDWEYKLKEQVISSLYDENYGPSEISKSLDIPESSVRFILKGLGKSF